MVKSEKGMGKTRMRWLLCAALPWLFVACAAPEPHWRFLSMPDFLNVDTDYPQPGWEEALSYVLAGVEREGADFLLVPGDLVMGEWHCADEKKPGIAGIEHFAGRYYPAWKARMAAHGIRWFAAVGDHELGRQCVALQECPRDGGRLQETVPQIPGDAPQRS